MALVIEVAGLVLGILGSLLLLSEPIRLKLGEGSLYVDQDLKNYRKRLLARRVGVMLLILGFIVQVVATFY